MDNETKDLEVRKSNFLQEYGELVIKHKMDFASYPTFVPNPNGHFTVIVQNTPVDVTEQLSRAEAEKSNFIPDAKKTEELTDPK